MSPEVVNEQAAALVNVPAAFSPRQRWWRQATLLGSFPKSVFQGSYFLISDIHFVYLANNYAYEKCATIMVHIFIRALEVKYISYTC